MQIYSVLENHHFFTTALHGYVFVAARCIPSQCVRTHFDSCIFESCISIMWYFVAYSAAYQYDAFWAMNERERTNVLKCVYRYTRSRADIPHSV